jgi:hypothetical protein
MGELCAEDGGFDGRDENPEEGVRLPRHGRKLRGGVELEAIPLCAYCEDTVQDMKESQILESGLTNIDRRDGGLSRSRLYMMTSGSEVDEDEPKQKGRTLKRTQKKKRDSPSTRSLASSKPRESHWLKLI